MLRRLRWLPWFVFGVVLAIAALTLLFTTFMVYDDEGYVLYSLLSFVREGGLYERVYSQYGPFFFLFNQGLHLGGLGLEFSNTSARILTAFYWLLTTGLCASIAWRVTRSQVAALATAGGVFMHLWVMTNEPSHPGGLIAALLSLAAWTGIAWQDQPPKRWLALGFVVAALCLTKINVGIFLLAGAGAWWAIHLDETRLGLRWRVWLIGGALALMPFALMRQQIARDWVATFAIVAGAAGAATGLAVGYGTTARTRWRDSFWVIVAGVTLALATVIGVMAQGTSWRGLLDGVLLGPLRHPQAYLAHVNWRPGALVLAVGSLALATACVAWLRARAAGGIVFLRLAGTAWFFLAWNIAGLIHPHAFALSYALAFTWLFVFPLGGDDATQPARSWLALLLIPQALHAYPVAGSQIAWGTFLWVPLAVIASHDAYRWCASKSVFLQRGVAAAAVALGIGMTVRCGQSAQLGLVRMRDSAPLHLPRANALLPPESLATVFRMLSRNAVIHSDVLFTTPGMLSFNLWTDLPTPTTLNATHWFTLLSAPQQEAIRAKLEASPRSCLIVQRDVLNFIVRSGIQTETPLMKWLNENYAPAFKLQTYEFWVRKGRKIAAVNTADLQAAAPGVTPHYQLSLIVAETALRDVTSIELAKLDGDINETVATLTAKDAQVFVTPLASNGQPTGLTQPVPFPFAAEGFVRIDIRTDRFPEKFLFGYGAVFLRDRQGHKVAEARFVQ